MSARGTISPGRSSWAGATPAESTRAEPGRPVLIAAAAAAVVVMAGAADGDVALAVVLLAAIAADRAAALTGALVVVATVLRWGTGALPAIAGDQAVLGAAGWVGPPAGAASSWLAAGAVVCVAATGAVDRGADLPHAVRAGAALGAGALAALLVAGSSGDAWIRPVVTGTATAVALAALRLPRRTPRVAAPLLATGAVALAALAAA